MDFTYFIALFLSLIVGFIVSLVFVLARGRSYRRFFAIAPALTVIADFALLEDWSRVGEATASDLLIDAAFFVAYAFVGCFLGALPVLGARWLFRAVKGRSRSEES